MASYYGERQCASVKNNKQCSNKAYFLGILSGTLLCGVHSRKIDKEILPKNPNKKQIEEDLRKKRKEDTILSASENAKNGQPGDIILYKMKMMKPIDYKHGYMNVFPNYRHEMPELSPKSIGPIVHGQPGLPIALNLENFHQGNKVFPDEIDSSGNILNSFYETQIAFYNDPVPHRHKPNATGNIPVCSIWTLKTGEKKRISYFESRQFYCTYYERTVKNERAYAKLHELHQMGFNLQICGYDAYPVGSNSNSNSNSNSDSSLEECYLDTTRPFGHELVLYSMLVLNPENYPWRKYTTFDF